MSSIKLKHSGGNGVSITAPDTNPSSDRTLKLPSTDADGLITTKDSSNNLQSVTGANGAPLSHRNILINGDLNIWQRGTSTTTSGAYQADRFWGAGAGLTYARSTDAPDGFQYSAKLTHGGNDLSIGQPVELFGTGDSGLFVSGEKCTLSFYAKTDSGTEGLNSLINFRNSKFSSTNNVSFTAIGTASNTITSSWARYSTTFTIPTVNSNNIMAAMEISGISKTAYFTGFQLELGDTATAFEYRSRAEQLACCQRYMYRCQDRMLGNFINSADFYNPRLDHPQKMRASPSLSNGSFTVHSGSAGSPVISATRFVGGDGTLSVALHNGSNNGSAGAWCKFTGDISAEL